MILKSIEMQGFKSFADKIYLDFNSGITAIVGPNGSGKSNISDAIRWVMGEQSIKSLRGSRMEDVIFAGTAARKPLGFAEVTLSLDNESGIFAIEFPEIRVTRRLYRSGESEYYINKTLCRLKDIHELFMDTGLGRDGYSIIGQGQIDNILSSKSEDRRQIFEEASGISKYKYRKTEAERKLQRTTDNLTRVEDILSELEIQLEPLEKQSEKAKKYLILRDEKKELDINVSVIKIEKKRDALKKLQSDIEIFERQLDLINSQLFENDKKVEALYQKSKQLEEEADHSREKERELTEEIGKLAAETGLLENNAAHSRENAERLMREADESLSRIDELTDTADELGEALSVLINENEKLSARENELTEKSEHSGTDVRETAAELAKIKDGITEKNNDITAAESFISASALVLDNLSARRDVINAELSARNSSRDKLAKKLEETENEIEKLSSFSKKLMDETNRIDEKYGAKNAELQKLISEKNKLGIKLGQLTSKKKMLEDMERDLEGYSRGVKGVISGYKAGRLGRADIRGPLSQLIKVEGKYITAVETALGNAAQNIVTGSDDDAKRAIKYLKDNKLGRATFLPITNIRPRSFKNSGCAEMPGYVGTADSLVDCADEYRDIVSSVLGGTVIVDNIDNAASMGKKCGYKFRIVTLGGDVIQTGGAMTGGSALRSLGTLSRANEIAELLKQISLCEKDTVNKAKEINAASIAVSELAVDIKSNNDKLSEYNDSMIKLRTEREHLENAAQSGSDNEKKLKEELNGIDEQISSRHSEIETKRRLIAKLNSETDELSERSDAVNARLTAMSEENEKLGKMLLELTIKQSSVKKDIERTNEKIGDAKAEKERVSKEAEYKRAEAKRLLLDTENIKNQHTDNLKLSENKQKELELLREQINVLSKERQDNEEIIKKSRDSVKDVRDEQLDLSKQLAKSQSKYENADTELENITNLLWEEYELTYSAAAENRDLSNFNFTAANKRIAELKRSIKALGNINIDSIEEYKNVKERVDFLHEQVDDLNNSKRELNRIISDMLIIMKERFGEQFKIINENFGRVFGELFGGGIARLSLSDPDNVLESGIEIEAQPPGKKLQSLSLLSGGEKAFTAIALLFAILDVRPTPFCILDEIEAALDDVNVYRFAEYLKNYSEKTQFIVVTHRRGTMEAANVLYGVTMQEKGISKMLRLNIDEVEA